MTNNKQNLFKLSGESKLIKFDSNGNEIERLYFPLSYDRETNYTNAKKIAGIVKGWGCELGESYMADIHLFRALRLFDRISFDITNGKCTLDFSQK